MENIYCFQITVISLVGLSVSKISFIEFPVRNFEFQVKIFEFQQGYQVLSKDF